MVLRSLVVRIIGGFMIIPNIDERELLMDVDQIRIQPVMGIPGPVI